MAPSLDELRNRYSTARESKPCKRCGRALDREPGGRWPVECPSCAAISLGELERGLGKTTAQRASEATASEPAGEEGEGGWCSHWPRLVDRETGAKIPCAWPRCSRGPASTGAMEWDGLLYTPKPYRLKDGRTRYTWVDRDGDYIEAKALREKAK